MLRLFLVRHGETEWNRDGRIQGHTDIQLSADGLAQSQRLAARLLDEPIDSVWSSDLLRARVTAEAIAAPHALTVSTTPLMRETMLGEWEGLTEPEIAARGERERWLAWRRDPAVHRPPGCESFESVWERMLRALAALRTAQPQGTALVVGHGGSLRVLLCEALEAPRTSIVRFGLSNASLSLIEYGKHRVCVRLVNDTGHLREPTHGR